MQVIWTRQASEGGTAVSQERTLAATRWAAMWADWTSPSPEWERALQAVRFTLPWKWVQNMTPTGKKNIWRLSSTDISGIQGIGVVKEEI